MQEFPHHYSVTAASRPHGDAVLNAEGPSPLLSATPRQFDGPGDLWSPETLLVAAIGDCLVLTFRGVARASKMAWNSLRCDVTGTLDRLDGTPQFTSFEVRAHLEIPVGTDPRLARRLLEKAEHNCLIANSLKGIVHLVPDIEVTEQPRELVSA